MDTFTGKEIEGSKVKSFKLLNKEDFQILFEDGGEFRIFGKYMHPCYLQHNAKDEGSAQAGSSPSNCSQSEPTFWTTSYPQYTWKEIFRIIWRKLTKSYHCVRSNNPEHKIPRKQKKELQRQAGKFHQQAVAKIFEPRRQGK